MPRTKKPLDLISIPADEAIKLVFGADRVALIRIVNRAFDTKYDLHYARLTYSNSNFVDSKTFDMISGDFIFSIDGDFYHFEFQTLFDKTMTFRIFSYGAAKAGETAKTGTSDDPIIFVFPQPLVVYLEENSSVSDELSAVLKVPNNSRPIEFKVPILKVWDYTLQKLIDTEFYLLIPFTLISFRKKFERVDGVKKHRDAFFAAYRQTISAITQLMREEKISSSLQGILYSATKNIADYFNDKYIHDEEFMKEVKTMPIGAFRTVIDDYADEVAAEAAAEAKAEAKAEADAKVAAAHIEGKIQAVVKVVKKWRCPLTEAMDDMELEPQYRVNVIEELEKQGIRYSD